MSAGVGIIGVAVGGIFWGSNFAVCKGYNLPDDGMHFVMLMSIGILFTGICTLFGAQISDGDFEVVFAPDGLVGGAIWAVGNFMSVPIITNIGLGMGIAIWGGVNLIVAFVVGVIGFGSLLEKESLRSTPMGIFGIAIAVCGLVLFSRIKPSLEGDADEGSESLINATDSLIAIDHEEKSPPPPTPKQRSIVLGIVLATIAGTCYGFQFVPLSVWNAKVSKDGIFGQKTDPPLSKALVAVRFFFSQFVGIFLVSLVGFVCYVVKTGNRPKLVPTEAMLPCILSGVVWAVGCGGSMLATIGLGEAVGFPLVVNISFLVNSSWSILYFREIRGKRNLQLFAGAFVCNVASSLLITLSKGP